MWQYDTYIRLVIMVAVDVILIIKIYKMKAFIQSRLKFEIVLVYSILVSTVDSLVMTTFFFFRDEMITRYPKFGKYSEWTVYIVSDIVNVCGAYSLFITSSDVRKAVWNVIRGSRTK